MFAVDDLDDTARIGSATPGGRRAAGNDRSPYHASDVPPRPTAPPLDRSGSGRALVAGGVSLTVIVVALLVAGLDTHDGIEVRVGIALAIAGALAARIAVRSRRASNGI